MSEETTATVGFVLLALIEGFNGFALAFRTKRTLDSARLAHADGPGLLIQEFGVYSVGLAAAYLAAAWDPIRFAAVGVSAIAVNLCAGAMHFLRSAGIYFGDARPLLGSAFERRAGLVHAFALLIVLLGQGAVRALS